MKKALILFALGFGAAISSGAADVDVSKLPPASKKTDLTYDKDIKPILQASCFRCHGDQRPKAGLRLDSLQAVLKGSRDHQVIVPGKSSESKLVIAVARLDEKSAMPPAMRGRGPGGPGGPGGPDGAGAQGPNPGKAPGGPGGPGGMGPMPKALTAEQVGLIRAWVDQGAK